MEERFQISATLQKELDKAGIYSVEELMYADLRRAGWNKSDAFYVSFGRLYSTYSRPQQQKLMTSYENSDAIVARITGSKDEEINLAELNKETSKEKILSDLVKARKRYKSGSKEWTDMTKAIAEYAKIKQDDIKVDEKPMQYFIPVHYPTRCEECLIYQNKKDKKR